MDINDMRSIVTVLAFATFIGIVLWAYSGRRRAAFDEAANLPFNEDEALSPRPSPGAGEGSGVLAAQVKGLEGKAS
ncbi:MAG: CcoQ/FixQ family Cbb3-type cytochrome c oxidase assembly chaperone [Rhodocyclales bacterium]|jgi:cytochrome c oxidase cbb3-type subunit 4|nr:MAG: CcoQ/FixQ family Cbb3-type cytochrome c oxidase assembly chaperone [Rhodocyclales bacterium]